MPSVPPQSAWLYQLLEIEDEAAREREFNARSEFHNEELLHLVHAELIRCLYSDRIRARRVGEVAEWAGVLLQDDVSRAIVARSKGNLLFAESQFAGAVQSYRESIELFERAGRRAEAGRVYFGGMQALIYLGEYEEAYSWADQARIRFIEAGDELRLTRLDLNVGNLYYRQDRYEEAMAHYDRAREKLAISDQPQDYAAVLSNSAVCLTGLGRFSDALSNYREVQEWCRVKGLDQLAAAADYNIAYLHYLRGEYRQATDLYRLSRQQSAAVGDHYHRALCDLDESEMMLELNMASPAQLMAKEAADQFQRLGMPYEYAKALVYGGLAKFRRGDSFRALRMLSQARQLFKKEGNPYWLGLLDLYRAIIFEQNQNWQRAKLLAERARRILVPYSLTGKFALCNLLLAKLALREDRVVRSKSLLAEASQSALSPALKCHISYLSGMVEDELNHPHQASRHYADALRTIEQSRHEFWSQEIKISYLQDKTGMYEAFAARVLKSNESDAFAKSFQLVQQAKSRTLLEDLESRHRGTQSHSAHDLLDATRNISADYRQVDALAQRASDRTALDLETIRARIEASEENLARLWAQSAEQELGTGSLEVETLNSISDQLPPDATLVEYFVIHGQIHAWLVSSSGNVHAVCGSAGTARHTLQLLQFQLARFSLGPEHLQRSETSIQQAVGMHLRELHQLLIAPIQPFLRTDRLVFAPHGFIHHVPFCALVDSDGRSLLERFVVSSIPSGSVYAKCARRPPGRGRGSLVLGVSDAATPYVEAEASAVAELLPEAELLLGEAATSAAVRQKAGSKRFLHIAAHGLQRRDNPLSSAVQLSGSELSLTDLEGLDLKADLVTLSGCSTGLSAVTGGDELLGLVRGVLTAGASSLLATLWDVGDEGTAKFIVSFYRNLMSQRQLSPARALRTTTLELMENKSDIYSWAAFQLIGMG